MHVADPIRNNPLDPTPARTREVAEGRLLQGFNDAVWNAARFEADAKGNVAKFGRDGAARDYLLGTINRVLVEARERLGRNGIS